jgi:tellurite resistance protein TehA-like permease
MVDVFFAVLALMRLILFGLAILLTIISFQAYRQQQSQRLEFAFIGFAFISMGTALSNLTVQINSADQQELFLIAETVPFIIGFAMLYLSLYR